MLCELTNDIELILSLYIALRRKRGEIADSVIGGGEEAGITIRMLLLEKLGNSAGLFAWTVDDDSDYFLRDTSSILKYIKNK